MENLEHLQPSWLDALSLLSAPICVCTSLGAVQLAIEFASGADRPIERLAVSVVSLSVSLFVALVRMSRSRNTGGPTSA